MPTKVEEKPAEAIELAGDTAIADNREWLHRLATDPQVDMDKLDRMVAMIERAEERAAKQAYTRAFAKMQGDIPEIEKLGTSNNGRFAKFEHVQRKLRPVLQEHGFSLSFRTPESRDGAIGVTACLVHEAGHSEQTTMYAPPDKSGNKSDIHAMASTTSYLKRYTAGALLNIIAVDEDDDGNSAGSDPEEEAEQPTGPPEGYEKWVADMAAVADNGIQALQSAWKRSADEHRRYITENEPDRWASIKATAEQAT